MHITQLIRDEKTPAIPMLHNRNWWRTQTKNMVSNAPDKNDAATFDRFTWRGIVGDVRYPENRTGDDLSYDREDVLEADKLPVPLR